MELTWLPDTPQSRRRTRALRACPSCQRKKKRCRHLRPEISRPGQALTTDISDVSQNTEKTNPLRSPSGNSPALDRPAGSRDCPFPVPGTSRIERFVGDLNPEAAIREKVDAPNSTHLRDQVGLWINTPVLQNYEGNDEGITSTASVRADCLEHHGPEISTLNLRFSSALKACNRLPRSTFDHLAAIYFSRVNHVLPLIDHTLFAPTPSKGISSVYLERAICLVAAKDKAAGPHLRLVPNGALMTPRKFCSELYNGLVCAVEAGLEQDRFVRIRILALMSLHFEGYEGTEAASMHLCQAIHQAQTAGLHLERPNRSPEDSLTTLFWCLWTLDKMHASIGGRPVLLADRDIGIKRVDIAAHHAKSAFDIWLALSELLSTVISFYRPSADYATGWEMDYPSFEEIMGDHIREDVDSATLGALELYYHAISILSCRYRPFHRAGGSRPSYTRQCLAAVRINSLVAFECAQGLPPLPIVSYAVSLSMGVSYQQIRTSKLITHFERAKSSLEACCVLLEELGVYWYSAEAMARLGRKALHQIDETNLENNQLTRGHFLSATVSSSGESPSKNASSAANLGLLGASMPSQIYSSEVLRPSEAKSPAVGVPEQPAIALVDEQQDNIPDGFADIDMLFGDFLDLSLPTNFWDPVFLPSEHRFDV
ncbi:hypothetical protein BDW62DRAFT_84093 [Aspergillus aurantiobrunneus]